MEENAKDVVSAIVQFFAFLVPGVLAYGVLLYFARDQVAKFSSNTPARRPLYPPGNEETAGEEKPSLNIFFVLIQVYVLGYVLFAFSGALELLPSPAGLIARQKGRAAYTALRDEFKTNSPPECKIASAVGDFSDMDLFDTAREYIMLKNHEAARDIEQLRTEFRLCPIAILNFQSST